ncbi:MAG: hypothetical protein HY556_11025 [Euryarchaeota archaeon]|nr:hypothetical protein [Euryarchaeota archaeon]
MSRLSKSKRKAILAITGVLLFAGSALMPLAGASHRYTALVDPQTGDTFEPDFASTDRLKTSAADGANPVVNAVIDTDGDSVADSAATVADLGNGNTMLDAVLYYGPGQAASYVHVNGYLRNIAGHSNSYIYPNSDGLMAWFGEFDDLDGDGTIDDTCPGAPDYNAATDEFSWRGAATGEFGKFDMQTWIIPGNHTGFVGDNPDVWAFGGATVYDDPADDSPTDPRQVGTGTDEGESNMRPDSSMDDRSSGASGGAANTAFPSGCPANTFWVMGNGFNTNYGDNTLIRDTVIVVGVFADGVGKNQIVEQGYNLESAVYTDVDHYSTINPTVRDLYEGLSATSRDTTQWTGQNVSAIVSPEAKPVMDVVFNGGATVKNDEVAAANGKLFAPNEHEPNTPFDRYSCGTASALSCNATYNGSAFAGTCATDSVAQPRGSCNSYGGYQSDWHLWVDSTEFASMCTCGTFAAGIYGPNFIGQNVPSSHSGRYSDKTFTPGSLYDFTGNVGQWLDKNADTWIGRLADNTQRSSAQPYRTTIYDVATGQSVAGVNEDPNNYGDNDPVQLPSEFRGLCTGTNDPKLTLRLVSSAPGGSWGAGVVRFNDFERVGFAFVNGRQTVEKIDSGPIDLPVECISGTATTSGNWVGRDYIAFLQGSVSFEVTVTFSATDITVKNAAGNDVTESVVDVDVYSMVQ